MPVTASVSQPSSYPAFHASSCPEKLPSRSESSIFRMLCKSSCLQLEGLLRCPAMPRPRKTMSRPGALQSVQGLGVRIDTLVHLFAEPARIHILHLRGPGEPQRHADHRESNASRHLCRLNRQSWCETSPVPATKPLRQGCAYVWVYHQAPRTSSGQGRYLGSPVCDDSTRMMDRQVSRPARSAARLRTAYASA